MAIQNKLDSFVFRMWIIYYVWDSLNMNVCRLNLLSITQILAYRTARKNRPLILSTL